MRYLLFEGVQQVATLHYHLTKLADRSAAGISSSSYQWDHIFWYRLTLATVLNMYHNI